MAYTAPGVDDFRARFPQFDAVTDDVVQLMLDEAALQVDGTWRDADAWNATLYLTAHLIETERMQGMGGTAGAGGSGIVKSETIGPIHYEYDDASKYISKTMGSLGLTIYGQRYWTLLRQNRSGAFLV
jgi:hypothetical protein